MYETHQIIHNHSDSEMIRNIGSEISGFLFKLTIYLKYTEYLRKFEQINHDDVIFIIIFSSSIISS